MWRLRSLVALAVVSGSLLIGPLVAHAGGWQDDLADGMASYGWYWNARVDVEGASVRTPWTVNSGQDLDAADDYSARITVWLPKGSTARILEVADSETVQLHETATLACTPEGVEARVRFRVESDDNDHSSSVDVIVAADGVILGKETGAINENLDVYVFIPTSSPSCN